MKRLICRLRGHIYSRIVRGRLWNTTNCTRCGFADPRPRCIRSVRDEDGSPVQCNLPQPCPWHEPVFPPATPGGPQ